MTVTVGEEEEEEFMRINPLFFLMILSAVLVECMAVVAAVAVAKGMDGKTLRYRFTEVLVKEQREIMVDEAQYILALIRERVEAAVAAI